MKKVALLLAAATPAASHDFKSCPGAKGTFAVTKIDLSPDPPIHGQDLTVTFSGTNQQDIAAADKAKVELSVKVFGTKIASIGFDVCSQLGVTCPLKKGEPFVGKITYGVPAAAPPHITVDIEAEFTDTSGDLDCYTLGTKIGVSTEHPLNATLATDNARAMYTAWKQQYPHVTIDDDALRFQIFKENFETIAQHNSHPSADYTMGMNEFGHLTWREFKKMYVGTGLRPDLATSDILRDVHQVPENYQTNKSGSVDWAKKGAVTAIKNQGQCGSCWAFSTTGSLEGAYFLKTGTLTSFSEQNLVDCDTKVDQGCNGGLMDDAFDFIHTNKGLCTEASYPYTGTDGTCNKKCKKVAGATVKKHTDVGKTQKALMSALDKQPVSIAIEADQSGFQFYKSGVFTGTCGTTLDHGVLAVGYGTMGSKKKGKYWKVKNSWGASWGMDGFILLERGKKQAGGQCGLLNSASYPTL
jgi:hypothetical protein